MSKLKNSNIEIDLVPILFEWNTYSVCKDQLIIVIVVLIWVQTIAANVSAIGRL